MDSKKIIFALVTVCLLTGCSKTLSKKEPVYVYTYGSDRQTVINLLDEEGKEVYTEKVTTKADISYSLFKNNVLFLHGPGGLVKFSVENKSIEKITTKDISFVQETALGLLYIENGGFDDEEAYSSTVYLNNDLLFGVEYPVNSAYQKDDCIYLSNIPYNPSTDIFIAKYDMVGNLLDKFAVDSYGVFQEIQNNLSYVTTKGYTNLDKDSYIAFPIVQNSPYNPLVFSDNLKTVDYRNGKTCEVLNLSQGMIESTINCEYTTSAKNGVFALRYGDIFTIIDLNDNTKEELLLERKDRSLEKLFVIDK